MSNNESNSIALEHPSAIKRPTILQKHGHQRVDNYFWMRLTDDQKSSKNPDEQTSEVLSYLEAENNYRENYWKPLKEFENNLYEEIVGRIKQTDMSVPYKNRGFWYINRFEEGKEYIIRSRKKETLDANEEILLDENVLSKNKAYFATTGHTISNDNNLLAYGEDTNGRRQYTIKIKDLSKNIYLYDEIKNTSGNIVWANDNNTIFYTKNDETLRSYKIYRHKIGTASNEDVEVYHEKDETFHCFVYKSRSKKYIIFGSGTTVSNEYSILPADLPFSEPVLFQSRERNHEYSIDHFNGLWYIRTNMENAFNFKLMTTQENLLQKENWKDFIQHREDVLLEGFNLFNEFLVVSERINGITNISVQKWNSKSSYINFGEESYMAMTSINPDPDSLTLRLEYTSLTTPATSFEFNMETGELKTLKEQEIVGGYNKGEYVSKRLYAEAYYGVKIPISIVYNKNFETLETMPVLLYGYGSYGISIDPSFSSSRISLLDRGVAFAIAHIRGGEDLGRKWYENGKLLNKKNTFNDFISCAEFLISSGITSSDKLFAMGGSAGGLLIGAVLNIKPNLWKAAIAAVPFYDVVTTMLDETIPLTTGEYDEWGNPNEKEFYEYMLSYSPYDNIEAKDYPALLVTTGYHDSQVQYWEPAKYTAKMRDLKTDNNPLLFYCNMAVGHGGASGRFERFREIAMEYTFILDQAGKITKD